jgi:hypothetical protein
MARDFSDDYVRTLRFPNVPLLHLGIRARPLIRGVRGVRRLAHRLSAPRSAIRPPANGELIASTIDNARDQFVERRWTFVDPFFTESFHRELVEGWPKREFLTPPYDLLKSYDRGFEWCRINKPKEPRHLDRHPALREAFAQLRSDGFARRVSAFAGGKHDLSCYSLIVTRTWPGSNVAPHRDSTAYTPEGEHFLNIVIFVDGTGGERSGGLAILGDNTFRDVIFESQKLRNTALIYATNAPFYHGFEPVRWDKFRWALLAQFCDRNYRG